MIVHARRAASAAPLPAGATGAPASRSTGSASRAADAAAGEPLATPRVDAERGSSPTGDGRAARIGAMRADAA